MPRHWEPKKDVISCEKPREEQISIEPRMSEWETHEQTQVPMRQSITHGRNPGTETSKYPEEEKETSISQVAASERERAQTTEFILWVRTA